jgi:hypothetical protein
MESLFRRWSRPVGCTTSVLPFPKRWQPHEVAGFDGPAEANPIGHGGRSYPTAAREDVFVTTGFTTGDFRCLRCFHQFVRLARSWFGAMRRRVLMRHCSSREYCPVQQCGDDESSTDEQVGRLLLPEGKSDGN